MELRKVTKESNGNNQTTAQMQSLYADTTLIEEEANKFFKQAQKFTSEVHSDTKSLDNVSIEQFLMTCNQFFDSAFTNVLDKRILFAAFAIIHQYFLSSNYLPIFDNMLPFSVLWSTFQKAFNLLDFNVYKPKIDEAVDKIKCIIDDFKVSTKDDGFTDDYDEIVSTFSLLFQCFDSIKESTNNSNNMIEKCCIAIDKTFKYINDVQSISADAIHKIQNQLLMLQQILRSYQKSNSVIDVIKKINILISTIPSTFDNMKFCPNNNFYYDTLYLSKIIKFIINFYSNYLKLMVNTTDWKEARALFMNTQKIQMIIEPPFLSSPSDTLMNENVKVIKNFIEKIQFYARDRSFKDASIIKDLSAAINILPPELFFIRTSLTNFMKKRRESLSDNSDTRKIFSVYQACVDFASQLRPSNGPIYSLTYELLQTYSRALVNSIVIDNLEIANTYLNRINYTKNTQQKTYDSMIISEVSKIFKMTQDFISCGIVSEEYKDFMNRFQLFLFFLKSYLSRLHSSSYSNALPTVLKFFPIFKAFKITKSFLNKDLNLIFQMKSEMVREQFAQFESEENSCTVKQSIESVYSAFSYYGKIIKEIDLETLNQFTKYFRFKKSLEDFTNYLFMNKSEITSTEIELQIEPNEFTNLFTNFLEKMQTLFLEKFLYDNNIIKVSIELSAIMIYADTADLQKVCRHYINFLKCFEISLTTQKSQTSFRYAELFILMKHENETTKEDTENVIDEFCQSLISFYSSPNESTFEQITSLYPSLKSFFSSCDFSGFENKFETIKKNNDLMNNLNKINSILFPSSDDQNFKVYDIFTFSNLLESLFSSFEKFISNKILTKESHEIVKSFVLCKKNIIPITLYSFYSLTNPSIEQSIESEENPSKISDCIRFLAKSLSDLCQTIEFADYQKFVKDELTIYASMFLFYLNFYPELNCLNSLFNEFIQLSNLIMSDYTPILYRMLKVIIDIFIKIKSLETYKLEIKALYQITRNAHSFIINALNMVSIKKDLKIIINNILSFCSKYKIEVEQLNLTINPIDDFFNYQKFNSIYVKRLFDALQDLYSYDSSTAKSPDDLEFTEIYDSITPSLPILNSLYDESIPYAVKNYFNDGCMQVELLTKKLESNIEIVTKKISEERYLINKSKNDEQSEKLLAAEQKEKIENILQSSNEHIESFIKMYKSVLDNKTKQNTLFRKNLEDIRAKMEQSREDFAKTNQELAKYTQILIPSEFENYSQQALEPLKSFQYQETDKSDSAKTNSSTDDDLHFDVFRGSEFNGDFLNTFLMKIEELNQQNRSLSRYINIQSFYSVVDEYMKDQQKKSSETNQETEQKEIETKSETAPQITDEKDNENNNENENDKTDGNEEDDYEYEYEYVDDEDKKSQYEEFEQDEIKLIMMINSLRNCGKNTSTLREFVSNNFKDSISKIELEFYRLIEKANELFNVDGLNDDENESNEALADLLGQKRSKSLERRKKLLEFAKSLVQDDPSNS